MGEQAPEPPARVRVPTCIGCGAISRPGACELGCAEVKLELVRADAYDVLVALHADADATIAAFGGLAGRLRAGPPAPRRGCEAAYRALQADARAALREHPEQRRRDPDWEPAEVATTWWCPRCGGIDAPQPCLGICVWRGVEWVERTAYARERERALSARDEERALRRLLRLLASVTPRAGGFEASWNALVSSTLGTGVRSVHLHDLQALPPPPARQAGPG